MSNWQTQGPPQLPGRPGGNKALIITVVLLAVSFVALVVCVGGLTSWLTGGRLAGPFLQDDAQVRPRAAESLEEKTAAVSAAFNRDPPNPRRGQFRPIVRLLERVVEATKDCDRAKFAEQLDVDRLFLEMQRSGAMRPLSGYERKFALSAVTEGIYVPAVWQTFKIMQVEFLQERKEAVVYGFFWGADEAEFQVRWWLVRDGRNWKVYDWELLDYGIRASTERAIFHHRRDDPRLERYFQCRQEITTADELAGQGDYEQAARHIRKAEQFDVLPALRDQAWLQIGHTWLAHGNTAEALACYRRVKDCDASPGAIAGQAFCYDSFGRQRKTLEFALRYEALLGRSPVASRLIAEALLALGRADEAVDHLQKALVVEPNHLQSLRSLGMALKPGEKGLLAEYVRRTDDPAETAQSLAESFHLCGDCAALEAMAELLEEISPDPARKLYLAALAKQLDDDFAAAAELYMKAFQKETDADKKQRYFFSYLEAMIAAERFVEAYRNAPDKPKTFEMLADCYTSADYDLPREDFERLIHEHGKDYSGDPWLGYHRGILLIEKEQYDQAENVLAAGMARTEDEEILESYRYARVSALYQADKVPEAYRRLGPSKEIFLALARYFNWETSPEKIAQLSLLVQLHGAEHPHDPWLDFYRAVVRQHGKDYSGADRLLARRLEKTDDESVKSAYRTRRLDVRLESDQVLSALREVEPAGETFAYLASERCGGAKWQQLKSLIDRYRLMEPRSPHICRWEAEMLWQQKDYAAFVRILTPWPKEAMQEAGSSRAPQLRKFLVRACLRLDRIPQARAAAEAIYDELGDPLPMVLVCARQRKIEETSRYLSELLPTQYTVTNAYYDDDAGNVLRSDEFLPVRRACPPGLPYSMRNVSLVLLLKQSRAPEAGQLQSLLAPVLGAAVTVTHLAAESQDAPATSFLAVAEDQAYYLTFGRERYTSDDDSYRPKFDSAALQKSLADHRAYLAIEAAVSNSLDDQSELATVCRLAAALPEGESLAVYFGGLARLIPVDSALPDLLRNAPTSRTLGEMGEAAWLFRTPDVDKQEQQHVRRRVRELRKLALAAGELPAEKKLFVKFKLTAASVSESHWLEVATLFRGDHGSVRYTGRLVADSRLAPQFRKGEPLSLHLSEVVDWKITAPDANRL